MRAAHWAWLMAPVPESVRRSSSTSLAASWKRFQPACSSARSRSARVVERIGSTILVRKGSRGGRIDRPSVWQVLAAAQERGHFEHVRWDVEAGARGLVLTVELEILARGPLAPKRAVEPGRDHGDPHLAVHAFVDHGAEDDVR